MRHDEMMERLRAVQGTLSNTTVFKPQLWSQYREALDQAIRLLSPAQTIECSCGWMGIFPTMDLQNVALESEATCPACGRLIEDPE